MKIKSPRRGHLSLFGFRASAFFAVLSAYLRSFLARDCSQSLGGVFGSNLNPPRPFDVCPGFVSAGVAFVRLIQNPLDFLRALWGIGKRIGTGDGKNLPHPKMVQSINKGRCLLFQLVDLLKCHIHDCVSFLNLIMPDCKPNVGFLSRVSRKLVYAN